MSAASKRTFYKTIQEAKAMLHQPQQVAIVTHANADGDAIGSALGVYHYLLQKGHTVRVIVPNAYAKYLHFLPDNHTIIVYEEQIEVAETYLGNSDLLVLLDLNALARTKKMEGVLKNLNCKKIMIDHHLHPSVDVDFLYWDTKASSTAELVYDWLYDMNELKYLNADVANCLYAGINSDTGRFKYNVTARVHQIAAQLIQHGANSLFVNRNLFDNANENRLRLLGFCLSKRLLIYPKYNTAIIYLSTADMQRFNYQSGDTEGVVNYPLSIGYIRFVMLLKEHEDIVKMSLRSKGRFSVSDFAGKHFNGGGHRNAAGAASRLNMQQTIAKIEGLLPHYQSELCSELGIYKNTPDILVKP